MQMGDVNTPHTLALYAQHTQEIILDILLGGIPGVWGWFY